MKAFGLVILAATVIAPSPANALFCDTPKLQLLAASKHNPSCDIVIAVPVQTSPRVTIADIGLQLVDAKGAPKNLAFTTTLLEVKAGQHEHYKCADDPGRSQEIDYEIYALQSADDWPEGTLQLLDGTTVKHEFELAPSPGAPACPTPAALTATQCWETDQACSDDKTGTPPALAPSGKPSSDSSDPAAEGGGCAVGPGPTGVLPLLLLFAALLRRRRPATS